MSYAIYGEQLYCSADGNRIAFLRCFSTDISNGPLELWVADENTRPRDLSRPGGVPTRGRQWQAGCDLLHPPAGSATDWRLSG